VEPKPQEKAVKLKDKLGICWKEVKKKNIDNHCHRCKKEETQTIYLILTYIYNYIYKQMAKQMALSGEVLSVGFQSRGQF
jgi:predicted amidophosphoribosyltransferase